ncbi:hypothetical protein Q5O24_06465 [Eubacteriaceae bacterium ES3]|nr:hypothetical protein Q5O24_06465 [Eubacteriaceae bacterium ES3]
MSESKADIESDLGVGSDVGSGLYNYVDNETGFGVSVVYDSGEQVRIKTLYNSNTS